MDAALKQKWVAALRSGKYKQHRGLLQDSGAYCCLGVMLVVGKKASTLRLADYGQIDVILGSEETRTKLTAMNDQEKLSFPEIADWIEANIPASLPTAHGGE